MFTRDSAVWWVGIIGSAVMAVGANLDAFPWLSKDARQWISLASFVVGVVSGKMATSPRPHSTEGKAQVTETGE